MLQIINNNETLVNNEKVATVTLEDNTVWQLTDFLFCDFSEFTETTHADLIEDGWEKVS